MTKVGGQGGNVIWGGKAMRDETDEVARAGSGGIA